MTVFRPSLPPPSWTTTRTRLSGTPGRLVSCATSHGLFIASAVRVMNEGAVQPTATMVRPFLMNSRRVIPWIIVNPSSRQLVLRHAHNEMHGRAQLVREVRIAGRHGGVLAIGSKRAQQRPPAPWLQRRLDKPVHELRDDISHRAHPPGIDQLIQAGRGA